MKTTFRLSPIFICLTLLFFLHPYTFSREESFLLINGTTDEILAEFGPNIDSQISPCSTFKIPLSLMGYDTKILKDEIHPTWDFQKEYEDSFVFWKGPQSPLSWMQCSCIWYSKILSKKLGLEKIQNYLTIIEYGNQDLSRGLIDPESSSPAWINSSLKISIKEQVTFIQKMIQRKLPISPYAIEMTKRLLFKENLPDGWKLFGKTGWSGSDVTKCGKTLEHSWFVGWIEKSHNFYPFAYLILDKKINLDERIPKVKELLINLKHL